MCKTFSQIALTWQVPEAASFYLAIAQSADWVPHLQAITKASRPHSVGLLSCDSEGQLSCGSEGQLSFFRLKRFRQRSKEISKKHQATVGTALMLCFFTISDIDINHGPKLSSLALPSNTLSSNAICYE